MYEVTNKNVLFISAPVQCTQGAVDLFLLVDGSRSITPHNFKFVKKFLRKLTSEFEVNDKEAHVGLLQFSDEKSMSYEFAFNEMHSNKQVKRAIKRMKYRAGAKTNTGDALRIVNRYVRELFKCNYQLHFRSMQPFTANL